MAAFDETSDQPRSALPRGPVFVDASGRRLRRVKFIGLGALGLVAGYVVLLLVAFIGGPNIAAPYLPLPPAPAALPSSPSAPASNALPDREAEPAEPAAPAAVQAPVTAPSAVPVAPPINGKRAVPSASGSSTAPSTEATSPGKSATAPGQTARPSAPTHP